MIVAIIHLSEQMWALAQMILQAPSKYQGPQGPHRFGQQGSQAKMEELGPELVLAVGTEKCLNI